MGVGSRQQTLVSLTYGNQEKEATDIVVKGKRGSIGTGSLRKNGNNTQCGEQRKQKGRRADTGGCNNGPDATEHTTTTTTTPNDHKQDQACGFLQQIRAPVARRCSRVLYFQDSLLFFRSQQDSQCQSEKIRVLTLIGKEFLWKRKPAIKKVGRAAAHAQRIYARRYDAHFCECYIV